jgi:hypothetical protein
MPTTTLTGGSRRSRRLTPLQIASQQLSQLISSAEPRIASLLRNPFNLDLAGRLLSTERNTDLTAVRGQVDLLSRYLGKPASLV